MEFPVKCDVKALEGASKIIV